MNQLELIRKNEWDCLILLDACRYDYFKQVYGNYLQGELKKTYSPGTRTASWLNSVFKGEDYKDVTYISGNPYINSKREVDSFDAREIFGNIVDLWMIGWSNEPGTVPPEEINKHGLPKMENNQGNRFIIHYMQPHAPYLTLGKISEKDRVSVASMGNDFFGKIKSKLIELSKKIIGSLYTKKIARFFGLYPKKPIELAVEKVGEEEVKKLYKRNLEIALSHVKEVSDKFPGKIVVTSDHGELLGENGLYGHNFNKRYKRLVEVPWLKID